MECRSIVIPGKPLGKQRPRVLKSGITYTPKETVSYETFVKLLYLEQHAERNHLRGRYPCSSRPFTRYLKAQAKDAERRWPSMISGQQSGPTLTISPRSSWMPWRGVAYEDDKQITSCSINKLYADEPKVIVNIMNIIEEAGLE